MRLWLVARQAVAACRRLRPTGLRRLEFVRAVDEERLLEIEEAGELARLEDGAFAVLARDDERVEESVPTMVDAVALAEEVLEDERLPLIEDEAARCGELNDLRAGRRRRRRDVSEPRRGACHDGA